jgi:hypothetical protein
MSEMVERVAMAICKAAREDLRCDGLTDDEGEIFARAAIEAMREPTRQMEDAADEADERSHAATWEHMIDAALKS